MKCVISRKKIPAFTVGKRADYYYLPLNCGPATLSVIHGLKPEALRPNLSAGLP
jgi:hypothetical protein